MYTLTYKPFGPTGILIEWPSRIAPEILEDILQFKTKIKADAYCNCITMHHAYTSLCLQYQVEGFNYEKQITHLATLYKLKNLNGTTARKLWHIPVCYDVHYGIDLQWLAREKAMPIKALIALHKQPDYKVYFTGFLPGFLYLGGLNPSLKTPRRSSPRLQVPKGAVAIGASQTGIYPEESPGGWHIIGNSPVCFFNAKAEIPCFVSAGDGIRFYSIDLKTYEGIKALVEAGVYHVKHEELND